MSSQMAPASSEEKFEAISAAVLDALIVIDNSDALVYWNPAAERLLGYRADEVIGRPLHQLLTPQRHKDAGIQGLDAFRGTGQGAVVGKTIEIEALHKDGHEIPVQLSISALKLDGRWHAVGILRDTTELKRDQEALRQLNRELRAISNCNQTLMRAEDEQALLDDICHIVCDQAGYRMAWVGYAENDDAKTVRPVAWAGNEAGYLAAARVTWADTELGRGPTGAAIRSGKTACVQDFTTNPQAVPWRENALQRGYRSSIALPLQDAGAHTFGALTIYSTEPNAFTADETRLLEELSRDLAFGIVILRTRAERKRAEEELQESETKYRRIVDTAAEGIWGLGPDTLTTFVNARMAEMLGYSGNDMIGRPVTDFMFEEDVPDHLARMENRRQGMSEVYERRFRRQDGEPVWVQANTVPIFDDGHRFAGAMAMFTDITERKRAERRLQREIEGGRALLELYDRTHLMADRELFDYALDQVVRLTNSSVGFFHRVSDDQANVILTTWNAEALKGCTADYDASYPLGEAGNWADSVRLKRPIVYNDYQTSPNKRGLPPGHSPVLRFMSAPILEGDKVRFIFGVGNKAEPYEDGDVVQLQLIASELQKILAQRKAADALRASEEQYRRFVEDDVAGVFITTPDGRVLACNPAFARMLGFASVEDVLATNAVTIYQDPAARDAVLAELRAGGRFDQREMAWQRLDGSPVAAVETAIGEFDDAGGLVAIRGYVIDVTERKRLEEQLRQSQKMEVIGRLAGGVAHDFNNLLTAINGYADILTAGMAPDDQRLPDVEEIRKAGERAAALTRQLLAFSRRQVLQPAVIDLNVVIAGIAPMLRHLVGEQIELRAPAAPDLGRVRADPSQIEQVVLNLVVNARDAMPAGGTLAIETANIELDAEYARTHTLVAPGRYVLLAVSDTGTGMSETTMAHLFEPFFTTKPLGEGTGLGLATAYGIVSQSGGSIAAYSEPGHGSVFKVYLPRVAETVEPHTPALAEAPPSGAETILLVEDEDAVRSFVERVLGKLGYTVTAARSGDEAFALAADRAGPIDLLITDVMLPGMNGREISERLTARQPTLRTLFISGYTEDSVIHQGVLDPGVAFLSKPFTPDALGHAVREVLGAQKVVGCGPDR
jgi:PAS domain S-box-containing protein